MTNKAQSFEKWARNAIRVAHYISMLMLMVLMLLGAADVLGRYFLDKPIVAATEANQILLAGIVFFGLAFTLLTDVQVKVDLVVSKFNPLVQRIIDFFIYFLSLVLFAVMTWQSLRVAIVYWKANRLVDVLYINMAIPQLFVTVGAFMLCVELVIRMVHSAVQIRRS